MLKINLENGALLFREENKADISITHKPNMAAVGEDVKIDFTLCGIHYERKLKCTDIEVAGSVCGSSGDTIGAISNLCSVFKPGGATGEGVEEAPVDNNIYGRKNGEWINILQTITDKEEAHQELELEKATLYEFGELTHLEFIIVPVDSQPIIIQFSTGAIAPVYICPDDLIELTAFDIQPNRHYEITIINHRASLAG